MNPSLGRIRVELAETVESVPQELVDLINQNVAPPASVKVEDVYVRTMYVVSDAINSYGGRFEAQDHSRLASMLVDSPVMVGHRKDKLPVARTFHAECIERNGAQWVRSYFYWLRSAGRATDLAENIDGGIYKECSIAFTYRLPECSICGRDIRLCEHEPFMEYPVGSSSTQCHYLYKKPEKLLETSLVYRGANRGTSISRELETNGSPPPAVLSRENERLVLIDDLGQIDDSQTYLVVPRYEGLSVDIDPAKRTFVVHGGNQLEIQDQIVESLLDTLPDDSGRVTARLVGLRGKQRCSEEQLRLFLKGQPTHVGRLAALIYPFNISRPASTASQASDNITARIMPHRNCIGADLPRAVREIRTRHGVEIWEKTSGGSNQTGYLYQVPDVVPQSPGQPILTLSCDENGSDCQLVLVDGSRRHRYCISEFDENRFARGRRFVARPGSDDKSNVSAKRRQILSEPVGEIREIDNGLLMRSARDKSRVFLLRPMRLKGENGLIFYQTVAQE